MQVAPYAGIVPPTSDWIVSATSIYYEGSLGASKTLPIAGTVTAGLDYQIVYTLLNAVKTWGITAGGWNFASSFGVPIQYTNVSSFHGRLPNDTATQFADIFFTPVVADYHLTKTDHIAFSVQIYAPTGAYNSNRLANAGQNTWTFTPTISYTKLFPAQEIELSANYGVEFYTTNNKTDYHNAPVSVLDLLALKVQQRMGSRCGRRMDPATRRRHGRPRRCGRRRERSFGRYRPGGHVGRQDQQDAGVRVAAMGQRIRREEPSEGQRSPALDHTTFQ